MRRVSAAAWWTRHRWSAPRSGATADPTGEGISLYLLNPFTFAAFRDRLERYEQYRDAPGAGGAAAGQHQIDRAMSALGATEERASAPKGISPDTLDLVRPA